MYAINVYYNHFSYRHTNHKMGCYKVMTRKNTPNIDSYNDNLILRSIYL